ncbi:MAG: hypothetical protein J0M33_26025 [Anaerolineae bacterium]|nr:hypothetical protein [Anaerolineae bacterium]
MLEASIYHPPPGRDPLHAFIYLVTGLHGYLANREVVPANLRRALNVIALQQRTSFPKTLDAFIRECHRPLEEWYPLKEVPATFSTSQPILVENRLGAEAEAFCMEISEQLDLRSFAVDIPQAALDNLAMVDLLSRLRQQRDVSAQQLYVDVRSCLIEQSYFTRRDFRQLRLEVQQEVKNFIEELQLSADTLPICDRCGLLEWRDNEWHGIKPEYCSDHAENSGRIRWIVNDSEVLRLKRGIHLRTFLPGRAELELFTFAEGMCDQFPEHLLKVERYPGFDSYDLRLTFADTIWAVDIKDHASPDSFIKQVKLLYNQGDLAHDQAFYVIPDGRMEDSYYESVVEKKLKQLPRNLHINSVSVFQQAVQSHIKKLTQPARKSRRKSN